MQRAAVSDLRVFLITPPVCRCICVCDVPPLYVPRAWMSHSSDARAVPGAGFLRAIQLLDHMTPEPVTLTAHAVPLSDPRALEEHRLAADLCSVFGLPPSVCIDWSILCAARTQPAPAVVPAPVTDARVVGATSRDAQYTPVSSAQRLGPVARAMQMGALATVERRRGDRVP